MGSKNAPPHYKQVFLVIVCWLPYSAASAQILKVYSCPITLSTLPKEPEYTHLESHDVFLKSLELKSLASCPNQIGKKHS